LRPLGRVDQQVVESFLAADQRVGQPGARQPGLRHAISFAAPKGLLNLGQFLDSSWRMFRKDRLPECAFSRAEGRNGGDGRPMTTTAFLAQMRVHPVYGVLFQQRGPAGIQAAARALPIRWSAPYLSLATRRRGPTG
jgi:hypothetical protein